MGVLTGKGLGIALALLAAIVVGFLVLQFVARPAELPDASPPGTDLPNGVKVAEGSSLLGPVLWQQAGEIFAQGETWTAIVSVTGDPLEVWGRYLSQFAEIVPGDAEVLEGQGSPGCKRDPKYRLDCEAGADGPTVDGQVVSLYASMRSNPNDVTGRYRVRLEGDTQPTSTEKFMGQGSTIRVVPPPHKANKVPKVGEPIAPRSEAGVAERFVLLEGSRLVTVYGGGSSAGGFNAILRVLPGADLQTVTDAYVQQATFTPQLGTRSSSFEKGGTLFRTLFPGQDAGIRAEIRVVDQPGDQPDFIFYSVLGT
jgi:hypothetical protein